MKIRLAGGSVVLIDKADAPLVARYGWCVNAHGYAQGTRLARFDSFPRDRTKVLLHRLILSARPGFIVDHRNGDKLDSRRANLRFATRHLNAHNSYRARCDSRSGVRGVSFDTRKGLWFSRIRIMGISKWLGYFRTLVAAARAYRLAHDGVLKAAS